MMRAAGTVLTLGVAALMACGGGTEDGVTSIPEFRASGNEPFWSVLISADGIAFSRLGEASVTVPYVYPDRSGATRTFTAAGDGTPLRTLQITLLEEPCNDSMADVRFPFSALVKVDGEELRGCAKRGLAPAGENPGGRSLSRFALSHAAYTLSWTAPAGDTVRLIDGEFQGEVDGASLRVQLSEHMAHGDVTGDELEDAVVVLITAPGGTGTFYDLALVEEVDGAPINTATALLGDRIVLHSLELSGRDIIVTMTAHGEEDPMCCPTQRMSHTYRVIDRLLVLSD